jgi:16S rRNA (guanine966-N2)-methyltransferase
VAWMAGAAATPARFDLILLDPPFDAGLHAPALAAALPLLAPGGWLYLEAAQPWEPPPGLHAHRQLKAGAVHAHLWRRDA